MKDLLQPNMPGTLTLKSDSLLQLWHCFDSNFTQWLVKSNNPKIGPYITESRFKSTLTRVVEESLEDILQVLLKEPEADYFWYTYRQNGGELTWTLPHHDVVPSDSLRVNKEKIKIYLREYKLDKILK